MKRVFAALLIMAAAPAAASTNLVTNGGFETGDFAGWTQFGNTEYTSIEPSYYMETETSVFGTDPSEGSYQAIFGPAGISGGITQTIATTAGRAYNIRFDLYAFPGGNSFVADFGGTTLLDNAFTEGLTYTSLSYQVVASSAATALSFTTRHDPSYFLVDNVSISAAGGVPEPATWALLIAGMGFVGVAARRRRDRHSVLA